MELDAQPEFFLHDVCSLKADPSLIGVVDGVHGDLQENEPVVDCLIIQRTEIPIEIQQDFLATGISPKGYVFVTWSNQDQGRSLVAEASLNLIDRSYLIGDAVKRHSQDAMSGTVVDVSESFILLPVCSNPDSGQSINAATFNQDSASCAGPLALPHPRLPTSVRHPFPDRLLYDIPGEELKRAQKYDEGDYIIYQDWLGYITDCDYEDVILLLEDGSVIQVDDPVDLELPIPDPGSSLVVMPEHNYDRSSLDVMPRDGGHWRSIPPERLQIGQIVVTTRRNIRQSTFLRGSYSSSVQPKGVILDVRPLELHVQWLCPNVFAPRPVSRHAPPPVIVPTHSGQLNRYAPARERLPDFDGVTVYDRRKTPSRSNSCSDKTPKSTGQDLNIGDRVRFRDPSGAAAKYSTDNNGHGEFKRIPTTASYGFELNEFKIVTSRTEVTVQWQDATVTREPATALKKLVVFETEISPGDVVSLKEKIEQTSTSGRSTAPFNEAIFLEGDYELRPRQMGIVQSVDSKERLAHIRWYENPQVVLLNQGNILQPGSSFGPLSDQIDEVSLYEIMEHSALTKRRRDMVLFPPEILATVSCFDRNVSPPRGAGATLLSLLEYNRPSKISAYLSRMRNFMLSTVLTILPGASEIAAEEVQSRIDWIGEVVDLGLDGSIVVRLGADQKCRDIKVPLERIVMVIDGGVQDDVGGGEEEEEGSWWPDEDSDGSVDPVDETIEYDGGERLDQDSGDEMWITDEEAPSNASASESESVLDTETQDSADDEAMEEDNHAERTRSTPPTSPKHESTKLLLKPPRREVLHFDVLDGSPPMDHHFVKSFASSSPALLRRLMREHKILSSSLPEGIYARTWESRLDLLRVLIVGPLDTPYELAPFIVDFHFDNSFPNEPPAAHFHSWTYGLGKINPNLYEEGKICLSLLGTWPGKNPDENWSEKASVLQILVSLMGLVLVKDPFYNEAGFEDFASEGSARVESVHYTEKAFVMARGFVKHALRNSVPGFGDVLAWLYLPAPLGDPSSLQNSAPKRPDLLRQVIQRAMSMIFHHERTPDGDVQTKENLEDKNQDSTMVGRNGDASLFISRLSRGAVVMLRKHIRALEDILAEAEHLLIAERVADEAETLAEAIKEGQGVD